MTSPRAGTNAESTTRFEQAMLLTKQSPRANFASFYSNVSRRVRFRCAYARCVATRPRAVRAMNPSCRR